MNRKPGLLGVLRRVHDDEDGQVSLENVLIIVAIALPILIFLIKIGWPHVRGWFHKEMTDLTIESGDAQQR